MIVFRRFYAGALLLIFLLATLACQTASTPSSPVIGEAFAGPASLEIRKEIAPKSATVAVVHYGDRLQVLTQRRHFLKVRTVKGAEGWVDERLLLDANAVKGLQQLSKDTQAYPTQGQATTYDLLNVHTEPNRLSPSYLQVAPGERFDVIGHRVTPRAGPARKPLVFAAPKPPRRVKERKKDKSARVLPPPVPAAPKPPSDWVALSKERTPPPEPEPVHNENEPEPVPPDDWTLIRNAKGQSGWVLTRRIFMAIPDEVAQYAEGKRITSYFSLGKIEDEGNVKDIWLWTTIDSGIHPYDFDSFRVFLWSKNHHRYETAYIQRRLEGYFPVRSAEGRFSLVVMKEDGRRYRQSFSIVGNRVQPEGEQMEAANPLPATK